MGSKGAKTARLYMYLLNVPGVSSRNCEQSKTKVSIREIARLIARNSFKTIFFVLILYFAFV